jgi:hypothetical protein
LLENSNTGILRYAQDDSTEEFFRSLFNQLRNEFLTAARRVATTKKQGIGEVVEWASGGAFKYGDVGRMTEVDTPKLRAATELMASAIASTAR